MRFVEWLLPRAPSDDAEAPPLPYTDRNVAPPNPATPDQIELEIPDDTGSAILEDVYTVIDYTNAKGHESRRRVTLLKISRGPNAPILTAICHERKAMRHFRCDRIAGFIDDDGVVTPCHEFLRDTLYLNIEAFGRFKPADGQSDFPKEIPPISSSLPDHPENPVIAARKLRDLLRAPLSILVTAARTDGEFHPEEHDAICRYAEAEAQNLRQRGYVRDVQISDLDALNNLTLKMRPRRSSAEVNLNAILQMPDDNFARFKRALGEVIMADGKISAGEHEYIELLSDLDRMREDLTLQH